MVQEVVSSAISDSARIISAEWALPSGRLATMDVTVKNPRWGAVPGAALPMRSWP